MRFLGIDYGAKRVGIAISDEGNTIAFPKTVLANDARLIDEVSRLIKEHGITDVVLGESKDFSGADNVIMKSIRDFKASLEEMTGISIIFEPEFLTSAQAERQGETPMLDASAAAIILQSYLDKRNSA